MKYNTFRLGSAVIGACLCLNYCASIALATVPSFTIGSLDLDCTSIGVPICIDYNPSNQNVIISFNNTAHTFLELPYYSPGSSLSNFSTVQVDANGEPDFVIVPKSYPSEGWVEGDLFGGDGTNSIMRLSVTGAFSPSPYSRTWDSLSPDSTDEIGICFDTNGIDAPDRLFVSTYIDGAGNGSIFKIKPDATTTQIYANDSLQLEALLAVPTINTLYGATTLAGKVIAADEYTSTLIIVNPKTSASSSVPLKWDNGDGTFAIPDHPEKLLLCPTAESDLWFVDWEHGQIWKLTHPADSLPNGTILLVAEYPTPAFCNGAWHNIYFWSIQYNSTFTNDIKFQPIIVKNGTGDFGSQYLYEPVLEGAAWVPH